MRILLISANTERFPEPVFPIGLAYLANALQKAGAAVRIFDMRKCFAFGSLGRTVKSFRPDRIGISLRNIDNAAYPALRFYLPSYFSLVESIRRVSDVPIILGGPAFSLFPREITEYLGTEGGIRGEGENLSEVFLGCSKGIVTASSHDLESVNFPKNVAELFPGFLRYRTIGIQTARGCPNGCIYCTYPSLEGRKLRRRAPETVAEEIASLHTDFGVRSFFVVDSLFNADEGHMVGVLERIVTLNLPLRFSCYLQPKRSDPSVFRLLKRAGCVAVDFGTDSGSPAVLDRLGKPFTPDDIREVSRACREAGIDFCHSLLFGGPGETSGTIRETVTLMDEVAPRAVVAMTGIRIYPGTEIERIAREEGVIGPDEPLVEPRFYFSRMGSALLSWEALRIVGDRRNWFFPGKKDWSSTLGYRVLHSLYRKGPLWRTFRK